MASLEELLPIFEQLKLIQLFSIEEVEDFINKCRDFEYKINKQTKMMTKDYLAYAAYLEDKLDLIDSRRKELKYDEIERPLKMKCAHLYRICADKFKNQYPPIRIPSRRSQNIHDPNTTVTGTRQLTADRSPNNNMIPERQGGAQAPNSSSLVSEDSFVRQARQKIENQPIPGKAVALRLQRLVNLPFRCVFDPDQVGSSDVPNCQRSSTPVNDIAPPMLNLNISAISIHSTNANRIQHVSNGQQQTQSEQVKQNEIPSRNPSLPNQQQNLLPSRQDKENHVFNDQSNSHNSTFQNSSKLTISNHGFTQSYLPTSKHSSSLTTNSSFKNSLKNHPYIFVKNLNINNGGVGVLIKKDENKKKENNKNEDKNYLNLINENKQLKNRLERMEQVMDSLLQNQQQQKNISSNNKTFSRETKPLPTICTTSILKKSNSKKIKNCKKVTFAI